MKLNDLTSPLYEAPIDDISLIGNWGDQEKSNSFKDKRDRKILQNPKAVEKLRKKFAGTELDFNFYFVNLPRAGAKPNTTSDQTMELGVMSPEQLADLIPDAWQLIQQRVQERGTNDSEAVNIIFTNNNGVNKVPMTSWIIGHRIGHAIAATNRWNGMAGRRDTTMWGNAVSTANRYFKDILTEVYHWKSTSSYQSTVFDDPVVSKFFEAIGTMKSARDRNLGGRPYEFMYEMFTQWLFTDNLKFNDIPRRFGSSSFGRRAYYMRNPEEDVGYGDMMLNHGLALELPDYFSSAVWDVQGKYLVM